MVYIVEIELDDGSTEVIEVMACDRHEAQVMAVQEMAEKLLRPTSAEILEESHVQ